MEQQLTDEQILKLSKENPNQPFKSESGMIAFQGKFYTEKDINDLILISKGLQNPVIRFISKIISLPYKLFGKKKKD